MTAETVTGGTFELHPEAGDGTYYFATRSVDKAGNWQDVPIADGDISIYYTAPIDPPGTWPDASADIEGTGGGCFIATAKSD